MPLSGIIARVPLRCLFTAIHIDKRPWLDFTVEMTSDFDWNDTDYYENGFGVDVTITLQNYGKSPALGVQAEINEVLVTGLDFRNDYHMESIREKIWIENSTLERRGHAVFPNDPKSINVRLLVSAKAIKLSPRILKPGGIADEKALFAWYIVSVFYHSPTDQSLLETSTVYTIWMKKERGVIGSLVINDSKMFKPIPKSKIILQETAYKRAK